MSKAFLLQACTGLLQAVLPFAQPGDAIIAHYFKEHRQLGARDRSYLADVAWSVVRYLPTWQWVLMLAGKPQALVEAHVQAHTAQCLAVLGMAHYACTATQAAAHPPIHTAEEPAREPATQPQKAWVTPQALGAATALMAENTLRHALQHAPPDHHGWLQTALQNLDSAPPPEAAMHNLPDWLATRLRQQYGEDAFWPLAQALLHTAPLDVRANLLKGKRNTLAQALLQEGFACTPTPFSPWGLRLHGKPHVLQSQAYRQGLMDIQDEGSQLLCLLTDARRNENVADFCAGAGGKTLALGAMMRGTGRLYAFDNSAARLDGLKPRLQRSGLGNVHTTVIADENDKRLQKLWGKLDRVLVDAPCSGTGTLRRHPDLKWRQTPQSVEQLTHTQQSILQSAARLLKPGGILIYATCSLLEAENQAIAANFCEGFGSAHGFSPLPWIPILQKHDLHEQLMPTETGAAWQLALLPHKHNTDGFFAAAWQKAR